jgi:hypothetical protein
VVKGRSACDTSCHAPATMYVQWLNFLNQH